jgi:arylsulfatase A-like enzyme
MRSYWLLIAMCMALSFTDMAVAGRAKPNIVFIFSDDHAIQTIGAYEGRLAEFCRQHGVTPHIDALAKQGGLFPNSFCGNSVCSPSRAAVMTGLHGHANGVPMLNMGIKPGAWTFPQGLRDAGYQSAVIGKWHLGTKPLDFDHWQVLPVQGDYEDPAFETRDRTFTRAGYATDVITEMALEWLDRRDLERPFYLAIHHKAPHLETLPPPRYYRWLDDVVIPEPSTLFDDYAHRSSAPRDQRMTIAAGLQLKRDLKVGAEYARHPGFTARNAEFKRLKLQGKDLVRWKYQTFLKDYLRCVKAVDDSVGRLSTVLEQEGIADNTIVIYSSDQGFYLGEHGWFDKRWIYEESIHMPFIIRWPGVVAPGTCFPEFIQNIDYAPTFIEMARGRQPEGLHGRSFVPILRGHARPNWRRSVYYHYYDPGMGMTRNRHFGVRTQRYTLAHFYQRGEWELFDNVNDPQQLRSVYDDPEYAEALAQTKQELLQLQNSYGDVKPRSPDSP